MKISAFLLFCCLVNIFAAPTYSQSTKITLNLNDATIEEVLNKIEDVSEFYFLFNQKLIDVTRKVNIDADKEPIVDILNDIFNDDIKFTVYDRQIILTPSDVTSLSEALQQRPVTGTITDATTGEPMPGVNGLVKGTTIGALSDVNGKYTLIVSDPKAVLSFSFVGYVTQEIAVGGNLVINVALSEDILGLEEVVVIGYGTTKKVTLTGAVSVVNSKTLETISSDNLVTQLQGKLPGLRVTQRTGQPGSFATLYDIRGLGTPLIVVNGIVMDGDDFVRLNPSDIEQISVLKDASAAVYGVKAANGVILVTTKRGSIGKPSVSYTGSGTYSTYLSFPRPSNAYQYAWALTQNEINTGRDPNQTTFTPEDLQGFKDGTKQSTDWYDVVTDKYATAYKHNITISGGSDKITYLTSIGHIRQSDIWKTNDMNYKRYNVRATVTGKITDNLEIDMNLEGMMDESNSSFNAEDIVESIWIESLPTLPIYSNNNPDYLQEQSVPGHHALAQASSDISGYIKNKIKTFQGILTLKYNVPFIDGLDAQLMAGYYNMDEYTKRWRKEFKLYRYEASTETYINSSSVNSPSTLYGVYAPVNRTTLLGQINYNKVLSEKHNLNATLVFEERHDINDNLQASKEFAIDIDQFYAGVLNPTVTSANIVENDNQSIIGRVKYDYLSKYLVEFGFNYNGSSKFSKGHRWGFFPYASAGWRISEEEFFKSNLPFITNLKFRGSWGIMGDDAAAQFQYLTGYNYPSGNYILNNKLVATLGFRGIPNPNITWYTIESKNIGIDLSLGKGLFTLQFDLFRRDRSGLLATRILTMPGTVGASLSQENLNKDMRKGFELVLGHSRTLGDLRYDISTTFSYSRGQKTYVERSPDGNSYLNWKNNTTDRWDNITWGYEYIGQFQSQEEINTSPLHDTQGNRTLQPGDYKYEDVNKDGIINTDDQLPLFRSNVPEINYDLSAGITYKQFDINVLIQGGQNMTSVMESAFSGALPWNRNFLAIFADCWHHEDIYDVSSPWVPGKYASPKTRGSIASNAYRSSVIAINSSYVRLKSMEIGYTLKKSWSSKLHLENMRVYVTGFNLLTFSKMKDWDPELSRSRLYPIMRDITFGLNVKF